jgi:hypothetical protein
MIKAINDAIGIEVISQKTKIHIKGIFKSRIRNREVIAKVNRETVKMIIKLLESNEAKSLKVSGVEISSPCYNGEPAGLEFASKKCQGRQNLIQVDAKILIKQLEKALLS